MRGSNNLKTFGQSVNSAWKRQFSQSTFRRSVTEVAQPSKLSVYGAVAAGGGIIALTAFQLMQDDAHVDSRHSPNGAFASGTRRQIFQTYGYLAGAVGLTGVAAAAMFRTGLAHRMMALSPGVLLVGSLVGGFGSLMLTRSIDYHQSPGLKHMALATCIGFQAAMMSPLAALGGPLLLRAATMTAAVTGSISLAAASAPSEAALAITGPLTLGLGLVLGSSIASIFFPGSKMLYNVIMWGGLAVHGGLMFVRTNRMVEQAQMYPNRRIDPINNMLGIYIDTLAIFARIAMMMAGNSNRRR